MAILQNDPTVERIETGGITSVREFVFGDNEDVFVPVGTSYHKIITFNFLKQIYHRGNICFLIVIYTFTQTIIYSHQSF